MGRTSEMISDDDDEDTNRASQKIQAAAEVGRFRRPRSREDSRERSRAPRFSVPPALIRDGIVYIKEHYYIFLCYFLEQVNYHGRGRKDTLLKLMENVEDATPAEKRQILLPKELEYYRSRLLYCEVVIEGLPSGVFFGSGFGPKPHEARASAAKDLMDKCLKLGIFTQDLCEAAVRMEHKLKIRVPHFRPAVEAIINICDFMGRELWPSDVMTARELEPDVIERLKKLFDKAIRRAFEKVREHPMNHHNELPKERHIRDYPKSIPRGDRSPGVSSSSSKRCLHCQEFGHSLEQCTLLIQQMEMKKRQAAMAKSPIKSPGVSTRFGFSTPITQKMANNLPYNGPLNQDLLATHLLNRPIMPDPHSMYGLMSAVPLQGVPPAYTELEIRRRVEAELKEKERQLEEQIREKILREEKERLERQLIEEKQLLKKQEEEMERKILLESQSFDSYSTKRSPTYHNPYAALPILNAYANFEPKEERVSWTTRKGANGFGLGTAFGLVKDGKTFVKQGLMWLSPTDTICKIQRMVTDCEDTLEILERRVETRTDAEMLESLMQAVAELGEQGRVMNEDQQVMMLTQLQQLLNQALEEKRKKMELLSYQMESSSSSRYSERDRSPEGYWRGSGRYEREEGRGERQSRSRSPIRDDERKIFVAIDGKDMVLTGVSSNERLKVDEKFWAQNFKSGKWESSRLLKVLPSPVRGQEPRLLLRLPNGIRWKRGFDEVYREKRF